MSITWQVQEPAVEPGGDVGGDYQAGEAWSVRLASPQVYGALITVYVFAEALRQGQSEIPSGQYGIQVMTEYLTCTDPADPGGTETWSDYVYDDGASPGYWEDGEAADRAARALAYMYAASPGLFTWIGTPFYHYEDRPAKVRPAGGTR